MFLLFKTKTKLKDIIPDNYIDIHSHLLPGIDDGAQKIEDSIALTQSLEGFGTSQFITTPHVIHHVWENSSEKIKEKETYTIKEFKKNNLSVPFRAAAEYMMDENFVNRFQSETLLTIKDNYVLVEMSYINPPIQLYSILFDLQVAGYIPVLAHPERYSFYHNNFGEYQKLLNAGCFFQLNLLSLVGYYGEGIAVIAEKLLKQGKYSFVGSDVHHANHIAAFDSKIKLKDLKPLQEIIANNQQFRIY